MLVMILLVCWPAAVTLGQGLSDEKLSEQAGFSAERLGRMAALFQGEIDRGAIPGVTLIVARHGKVVY